MKILLILVSMMMFAVSCSSPKEKYNERQKEAQEAYEEDLKEAEEEYVEEEKEEAEEYVEDSEKAKVNEDEEQVDVVE